MSTKIASLYAEIGAKTDGFEAGAKKVKGGLNDMSSTAASTGAKLKSVFLGVGAAVGTAAAALAVLKKGYDFAREGAQIEFTATKFDRLAASIGTTGDALMGQLKEATHGTLSDMELMASATDLVGLGLVKTSKDAVRLSTVVSGLGMDMNQLVLTLSNQTTMRFDQLGVAVSGFDDKVAALKATGMDTNAAFTEAFLQQAEEQLLKVGNAADTTLGSFMKLEASMKNASASAKEQAAVVAGPLIESIVKHNEETLRMRDALKAVNPELYRQHMLWGVITPAMRNALAVYDRQQVVEGFANKIEDVSAALLNNTDIVKANTEASKAYNEVLEIQSDSNKQFLNDLTDVAAVNKRYNDGLREADAALAAGKMTTEEHASAVAALADEYDEASKRIVASMLEMKYMADGVFTTQEMNSYISGLEKLGLITEDDAQKTRDLMVQADLMTPSFVSATHGVEELGNTLPTTTENLRRAGAQANKASPHMSDLNQQMQEFADVGAREAAAAAAAVAQQLNQVNGSSAKAYIDIYIQQHGNIPTSLGGTQGQGSSVQTGHGNASRAEGGPLGSNWTVVGDAPGGAWTPWTEVVTPWGYVLDAKTARRMKDAGMFAGAVSRYMSGPVSSNAGNSPGPSVPPGTTHGELNGGRPSGGRAGSPGFGGRIALMHGGVAATQDISAGGATASAQTVVMTAAIQQQTAATNETNKLLKQIVAKTATAGDIGYSVASNTQTFK